MSNIIKTATNGQVQKYTIDSNPKASMVLSGLRETMHVSESHVASDTGPLPAAVENAIKEQAALILDQARQEERQIKEQALKEAKLQKENILKKAKEDGYEEGYKSGTAAISKKEKELKTQIAKNRQDYEKQVDDLQLRFSELVIRYVEKLTGIILEEHRPVIGYLMREAVLYSDASKSYSIHVSPEDLKEAEEMEGELRDLVSSRATLEILPDNSLQRGDCKLETDSCVLDTSLGTRMEILKKNLRLLVGA